MASSMIFIQLLNGNHLNPVRYMYLLILVNLHTFAVLRKYLFIYLTALKYFKKLVQKITLKNY